MKLLQVRSHHHPSLVNFSLERGELSSMGYE